MRTLIAFSLASLIILTVRGQDNPFYVPQKIPNKDSLLSVINSSTDDLVLLSAYRELGFSYYESRRDSGLLYFEKSLLLAKNTNRKLWEADACNSIGFISYIQGNYPRALQFLLEAKSISEGPSSENNTWNLNDKSKVTPTIARLSILSRTHNHLAMLYGYAGNFKDHVELEFIHFKEGLRLARLIDDVRLQSILNMNMGRHYSVYVERLDSALYYGNKALALMDKSGYSRYKGIVYSYMGNAYSLNKQYELAKDMYWQALKSSEGINNLRGLGEGYLALSNIYRVTGVMDSSIYYGRKALATFQYTQIPSSIADAFASLSATYELKNNTDSAFKYLGLALKTNEVFS